jgi:hypothetical protein
VIQEIRSVWTPSPPGYEDLFRLDPREAIIILAQMPSPARYFSEQSFVFTRQGAYDSEAYQRFISDPDVPDFARPIFFRTVPLPENIPQRILLFSSLSDTINNVVIERKSGKAFDQMRHFIITPDQVMDQKVRDIFKGISVRDENIFTEQIPSNLKIGLSRDSDDFVTLFRYAQPDDGGAPGTGSYIWRKNLPLVVLRVRHTAHSPQPYPAFTKEQLEPRTAFDEYALQDDLNNLVSAVSSKWGRPCTQANCSDRDAKTFLDFQRGPIWMQGPLCVPIGEDCLGDNWDAAYFIYGRVSVDHEAAGYPVWAVAGALGTRTGNATYVGLSINKVSKFVGVKNFSDRVLQDTAQAYEGEISGNKCPAVNNTKTTDCLFLYYFTRDCSVVENVTGERNCFEIDTTLIPEDDSIVFGLRDYVRPETQRGPDSQFVLPAVAIRVR